MGPSDSPFSVVDPQLRVRGVDNLRVIDASVMPQIPVTNTQAGIAPTRFQKKLIRLITKRIIFPRHPYDWGERGRHDTQTVERTWKFC